MDDLLNVALEAHGGLGRWNKFTRLKVDLSIGGAIWDLKQQPGLLTDKTFEIDTHEERLSITPFRSPGLRSVFVPKRLTLETMDCTVLETRDNPQAAFAGQVFADPWVKFHVAYCARGAVWTYVTLPVLYTYPGFYGE